LNTGNTCTLLNYVSKTTATAFESTSVAELLQYLLGQWKDRGSNPGWFSSSVRLGRLVGDTQPQHDWSLSDRTSFSEN